MLERLEQVNWARLTDACGTAEHVPDEIRALASAEAEIRNTALRRLGETLCHDGYRGRATAPAVPFLFEILENTKGAWQRELIQLLLQLAVGYPEQYLPFGFDPRTAFPGAERLAGTVELDPLQGASPEADEELNPDLENLWARNAYEAVERQLSVFRDLARDAEADEVVRRAAVRALAWFPRGAPDSARVVRPIVLNAQHPGERANAILCLGILGRYLEDPSDVPLLQGLLTATQPVPVRLAAALSLGVLLGDRLPEEAWAILLATLENPQVDRDLESVAAWHRFGPVAYVADLLAMLRPRPSEPLVSALCRAAAVDETEARPAIWVALLTVVFRRPRPVKWIPDSSQPTGARAEYLDPAKLTANQLRALQAIGRNPLWLRMDPLCDQHMDLCEAFGLPRHRNQYRALLAAGEARKQPG